MFFAPIIEDLNSEYNYLTTECLNNLYFWSWTIRSSASAMHILFQSVEADVQSVPPSRSLMSATMIFTPGTKHFFLSVLHTSSSRTSA
jgi:hypothetical protein